MRFVPFATPSAVRSTQPLPRCSRPNRKNGARADLLLVDGNPLEDLEAIVDRDNLKIIMKDGKVYRNTLK